MSSAAPERPTSLHLRVACLALLAIPLLGQPGCTQMARQEVAALVAAERTRLDAARSRITDVPVVEYLNTVAGVILEAARKADSITEAESQSDHVLNIYDRFEVVLVHDPFPNAWVVGDDFACVHSAAILMTETPDELAFILAHEYGHLRREHQVRTVTRRYATEFAAGLAAGLATAAAVSRAQSDPYYSPAELQRDLTTARLLALVILATYRPYDKNDEFEADDQAMDLLLAAGLPLDGGVVFLSRLLEKYGEGPSESHPPLAQRIARLRGRMQQYGDYNPPVEFDVALFARMRERVRTLAQRNLAAAEPAFYSFERRTLSPGKALAPLQACGPLHAPPDLLAQRYVEMLRSPR